LKGVRISQTTCHALRGYSDISQMSLYSSHTRIELNNWIMNETVVTYGGLIKITTKHICQDAPTREGGRGTKSQRRNGQISVLRFTQNISKYKILNICSVYIKF